MFTLKKSGMKYKDSEGNVQDVGAVAFKQTVPSWAMQSQPDITLSIAGQAADAKAVGDKLAKIKINNFKIRATLESNNYVTPYSYYGSVDLSPYIGTYGIPISTSANDADGAPIPTFLEYTATGEYLVHVSSRHANNNDVHVVCLAI